MERQQQSQERPQPRKDAPESASKPKAQQQPPSGKEAQMQPQPVTEDPEYKPAGRLADKVAIVTGGDSGIGRAVAILYAREGAKVAILYHSAHEDAEATVQRIRELGGQGLRIAGDVGDPKFCAKAVAETVKQFGRLDVLVNNAAEQQIVEGIEDVKPEQLEQTFRTNLFGYVYMAQAALPHLGEGAAIINTTSVQAYRPKPHLMPYASTKGAILNFTRSLATELVERKIRVNAVAPGPVWTPLIVSSFPPDKVAEFGKDNPLKRAAQPAELAPSYVFLASEADSRFIIGQVIHVNGGSAMMS